MSSKDLNKMYDNLENTNNNIKKKKISFLTIFIVLIFIILISGVGFLVYKNIPKEDQKVATDFNTDVINDIETGIVGQKSSNIGNIPINIPAWQKKYYKEMNAEDIVSMLKFTNENVIGQSLDFLPSVEDGFTSDKAQEYVNELAPNMYYVPMTKEDIQKDLSIYIYRLINPIFGGWTEYIYADNKKEDETKTRQIIYTGMFDIDLGKKLMNANKDLIPLYNQEFTSENSKGVEFIGVIRGGEFSVVNDKEFKITLIVDFMKSKDSIWKTKKYILGFKINDGNKLVITSGEMIDITK